MKLELTPNECSLVALNAVSGELHCIKSHYTNLALSRLTNCHYFV